MERVAAAAVWRGMEVLKRGALRAILEDSGIQRLVSSLSAALQAIASRTLPEQLFSLLDEFDVVQLGMREVRGDGSVVERVKRRV